MEAPANHIKVKVVTQFGDIEKPITTEFPQFICANPDQMQMVSDSIVRVIRQEFDRLTGVVFKDPRSNHVQTIQHISLS